MADAPPTCEKCGSKEVQSNQFDTECAIRNTAHHLGSGGNPLVLGIAAGLWLAGAAINAFHHTWKCSACGHEFTPAPPPPPPPPPAPAE